MRYFGSKASVVKTIGQLISSLNTGLTFCDPFGGVGIVGKHFKSNAFSVTSGDVLRFATFFQESSLCRSRALAYTRAKDYYGVTSIEAFLLSLSAAQSCKPKGWFVEEYATKRQFFTPLNAIAIDRCWREIIHLHKSGLISALEHAVLMASLIDSVDRVANTAGTYYAYLKVFSRRALQPFRFRLLPPVPGPRGDVRHGDALDLVKSGYWDVLYLDPPYNERDYGGYYHLPETLAGGQQVTPCGMSGRPGIFSAKSRFTRPAKALSAIEDLVRSARFGTLLFHYADDGLVPERDLQDLLRSLGSVNTISAKALGYRTTAGCRGASHRIYVVTHA